MDFGGFEHLLSIKSIDNQNERERLFAPPRTTRISMSSAVAVTPGAVAKIRGAKGGVVPSGDDLNVQVPASFFLFLFAPFVRSFVF